MVKLVDTLDCGSSTLWCEGSSPSGHPIYKICYKWSSLYIIQNSMIKSFEVMLNFYGLMMTKSRQIVKASNFDVRRKKWIKINNHNYLRITRILKSLVLFGLNDEANNFLNILIQLKSEYSNLINDISIVYWKEAININ